MAIFGREAVDEPATIKDKMKRMLSVHWRGLLTIIVPLISLALVAPSFLQWQWCAYTLSIMAIFWVTECIPLPITAFLPFVIFPIANVMTTQDVAKQYLNPVVVLFLGSIMMALTLEQSGVHLRLALNGMKLIGYSHYRLLFTVCFLTMFVSMWIANTAATTMFIPIVFAVLRVFEQRKLLVIYEPTSDGEGQQASDITTCYFCACTFSATIGGIGTLVGTGTNLAFKALYTTAYPEDPEYISFPLFSAFSVPYMLIMEAVLYLLLITQYFGFGRPKSKAAIATKVDPETAKAASDYVNSELAKLGRMTFREYMAVGLFALGMVFFFCRSPMLFFGWGDFVQNYYSLPPKWAGDEVVSMFIPFMMALLPSSLAVVKKLFAKYKEDMKKGTLMSVLDFNDMNNKMPYSFMFLLGGGFCLSTAAGPKYSDLNGMIGKALRNLSALPSTIVMLFLLGATIFITNFASNVAVCNVLTPIAMKLADEIGVHPLWYCLATGLASSYCFMLPVGTPGNLIVQAAALIPTGKMMKAGFPITIAVLFISLVALMLWAPVIWPVLRQGRPPK